jgi:hypothetical protein
VTRALQQQDGEAAHFVEVTYFNTMETNEMRTTEGINWERDFGTALERAKVEQRLVLLDIFNPG